MLDEGLTCSLQYFSSGMSCYPFVPFGHLMRDLREYLFEVFPLDCQEPIFVGIP
jgi:hypothetical protein